MNDETPASANVRNQQAGAPPCLQCGRCAACHAPRGDCPVPNTECEHGLCPQATPAFRVEVRHPTWHALKVIPPYFDPLFEGDKTFEVRRNDRAFQRGDMLRLREWMPERCKTGCGGSARDCPGWTSRECVREVTFVYSGDPRFGGIEPGHVVLSLRNPNDEAAS